MILNRLWERYIFKNLIEVFTFFLLCFFLLYSLIDFSTHAQEFIKQGELDLIKLQSYYTYQILKRLPILLPLALLISTIKVLLNLNSHRELITLQASGIQLRKILRPFFLLAALCSLLSYANEEFFIPKSISHLDQSKQTEGSHSIEKSNKKPFSILYLKDSSKLVYQSFEDNKKTFFDVYWIRSFHDIWRMKYLKADQNNPIGEYVDHLVRNEEGFLEKTESHEKLIFPLLKWESIQLNKKQASIKHQKISDLFILMLKNENSSFHLQGELKTQLFYKLAHPLLPFLVLFGIIPFCVTYSRSSPIFMIYGISIFSFVIFFTLMNALLIIGENQVLPPYIAIFLPFTICFGISYLKYYKTI